MYRIITLLLYLCMVSAQLESTNHAQLKQTCVEMMTPEERADLADIFTDEQLKWFCHEMANHRTQPSNLAPLTNRQSSYLDFVTRCEEDECLEFAFPSDFEEQREVELADNNGMQMVFGLDTRCSHPQIQWRPRFCNDPRFNRTIAKQTDNTGPLKSSRRTTRKKRQTFAAKRKEYRMLTDLQRHRLHRAINMLKEDKIDGMSQWDLLTTQHYPDKAVGGHWGPAFLPWHREFLRQLEVALRSKDPGVALAYWDTTLDHGIPDSTHSILWTPEFFGNNNGFVHDGPFANWKTLTSLQGSDWINKLYRDFGTNRLGRLMSKDDVTWTVSRNSFKDLTFCHSKRFEMSHGLTHVHVGGFMKVIKMSPNDPVFYLLHSFVDSLWERFRTLRQNQWQRENDWADESSLCNPQHHINASMLPFHGMKNRDGLGSHYTRFWYQYDPYPSCTTTRDGRLTCGSKYLFCDRSKMQCKTKIIPGGNCTGFENQEICHDSQCLNGFCSTGSNTPIAGFNAFRMDPRTVQIRRTTTPVPPPTPRPISAPPSNFVTVFIKILVLTIGNWPLKDRETQIETRGINHEYYSRSTMVDYTKVLPPEHPGLAYISVKRPTAELPLVVVDVSVRDGRGEECVALCYNSVNSQFTPCQANIRLGLSDVDSDPVAFTHSSDTRPYLNMALKGHPEDWRLRPPFLTFSCRGELSTTYIQDTLDLYKPSISPRNKYVWFWILVVDRNMPFQNTAPEASVLVRDEGDSDYLYVKYVGRPETHNNASLPYGSGVVFLRARNPSHLNRTVIVNITVRGSNGNHCQPKCIRSPSFDWPVDCDGRLKLATNKHDSRPIIPFTDNPAARPYIGWNMTDHPQKWTNSIGHIRFDC